MFSILFLYALFKFINLFWWWQQQQKQQQQSIHHFVQVVFLREIRINGRLFLDTFLYASSKFTKLKMSGGFCSSSSNEYWLKIPLDRQWKIESNWIQLNLEWLISVSNFFRFLHLICMFWESLLCVCVCVWSDWDEKFFSLKLDRIKNPIKQKFTRKYYTHTHTVWDNFSILSPMERNGKLEKQTDIWSLSLSVWVDLDQFLEFKSISKKKMY